MTAPEFRAGWYPDPAARFELRYHNGHAWTADVSSAGQRFIDPHGVTPPDGSAPGAHRLGNGMGIAAMVLGIVSLTIGWVPFVFAIGIVLAILAIILGSIAIRRGRRRGAATGPAIAGLVTGLVGIAVGVVGLVFTIVFVRAIDEYDNPVANDAEITACERDPDTDLVTASGTITNLGDVSADFSIRIEFVRDGTDNAHSRTRVSIEDVRPGETRTFAATRAVDLDDVDCRIRSVDGPLPFGVEIEN